jgi:predicted acetyltransferase
VPKEEKMILNNLMQFYFYDFSEFVDSDVEDNGLYGGYPYWDDYWISVENRFPYFLKANGKNVGFVLVRFIDSIDIPYFSIAEFFVMKKYRRLGIGKRAAMKVFDMHRGRWEVFQLERNIPAQQFWNNVITEYTLGRFSNRTDSGKCIQEFFN